MKVTSLARYAVKGLAPDMLESVHIAIGDGETFPDDRRFALLKYKNNHFDANNPEWVHKENFLCAFTAPELMATLDCKYTIRPPLPSINDETASVTSNSSYGLPNDEIMDTCVTNREYQRLLAIWERSNPTSSSSISTKLETPLFGPVDLATVQGRMEISQFFTNLSKEPVVCVTTTDASNKKVKHISKNNKKHHQNSNRHLQTHQFGNTRSGVKNNNGDTRTVHLVNAATVRQVSEAIGVKLNPMRFRPNIVIDGLEPWKEFDFVGKSLRVISKNANNEKGDVMEMDVISTTVRCAGIGIDPLDAESEKLDIPLLLNKHFPQYGPYLGVYAVIKTKGDISLGDEFQLIDS